MKPEYIKAFLIIWGLFLLGILICLALFTLNRIKNDTNYMNALIENTGKPIIYEQYYHSPQK